MREAMLEVGMPLGFLAREHAPMPFVSTVLAQYADEESSSGALSHSFSGAMGVLPGMLLYGFMIFMAVHAARSRRWLWLAVMIVMPFGAIWYFLYEYRN